jgi:FkbH-like protein/FkbM family methyltransferase
VEYRIGLSALPYLADHGFHDMVVLPGSFYIELVRRIHRELFQRDAISLHRIEFERPVILTDDVVITVRAEQSTDGRVAYELFEATSDEVDRSPDQPLCARLEVDVDPAAPGMERAAFGSNSGNFSKTADRRATAAEFYGKLRSNGNEYGTAFQVLDEIRQSDLEASAHFADTTNSTVSLSPPRLDAAPQLLSAFSLDHGRTFILKSIDRLVVHSSSGRLPWEILATRIDSPDTDGTGLVGSVAVFDADDQCLWEVTGVTLAFIDRPAAGESTSSDATQLSVASTFTAEPLEDSLRFWGEHFNRPVRVEFAPYNQVFQQLLDPTSAFHRNRAGINSIVLGLEDWLPVDRHILRSPDPKHAAVCFGARPRTVLPNGLEIVHLNSYETDYVYQEIFEDQSYLRHDIRLADGDTVIDIGANIGLFSLFVMSRCRNPAIYAFEPSPRVFDLLQANCAAYGDPARVHAFNRGVSEKKGQAQFTFYEHSSVFSSFHPDEREDRAAVEAVVRNVMEHQLPGTDGVLDADVDALTTNRLRAETIDCPLTCVSDIIRENGLQRIHLLKIDAEKSEIEILRGIAEEHWPLIEQIVMEVHDRTRAAVQSIEEQLTARGFRCAVVEEKLLEDSGLFNIYATRRAPVAAASEAETGLSRKVEEFCAALDSFVASSSSPLIIAIAPHSPSAADVILNAAENQIVARAARHPHVRSIGSKAILAQYPVRHLHDAHSHQLAHIPFTPEGYAAIGTSLSRAVFHLTAPPIKVIALDCDNTLWQGLCAEDGPTGIAITPAFRHLQEFMIRQTEGGTLLTVCSKNQEADVWTVFDQRSDLLLRREHLAGWRINWESKPTNLRALAAQLNLGLDSFVFIDDNPVECAAVRAGCPEVTVLQLPAQQDLIPTFLENVWLLDHTTTTREDRERGQWYHTNTVREELRSAAPTLRDFLDNLQLRIDVTEATDEQLGRVAQLTLRTNQFNLTSIRRSEAEIRDLLKSGARCLVTSVSDRFGDYGLVGAILYTSGADRCVVDTLLLSCRALGKGVEHQMIAELAARALREGQSLIELPCRPTDRNEPARAFLEQLGPDRSTARLAKLHYAPDERSAQATDKTPTNNVTPTPRSRFLGTNLSNAMQRLGDEFTTIESIVTALEAARQQAEPTNEPEPADETSGFERSLTAIWKKALNRTRIGPHENFFEAGGTSLKAVVVVAMIRKELKKNISIVSLFECPTIALLAARLDDSAEAGEAATAATAAAASAESRGRQRRIKLVKRRVA